jgi:hypothetical protein
LLLLKEQDVPHVHMTGGSSAASTRRKTFERKCCPTKLFFGQNFFGQNFFGQNLSAVRREIDVIRFFPRLSNMYLNIANVRLRTPVRSGTKVEMEWNASIIELQARFDVGGGGSVV